MRNICNSSLYLSIVKKLNLFYKLTTLLIFYSKFIFILHLMAKTMKEKQSKNHRYDDKFCWQNINKFDLSFKNTVDANDVWWLIIIISFCIMLFFIVYHFGIELKF